MSDPWSESARAAVREIGCDVPVLIRSTCAPGVAELRLFSEDGHFRTFYFPASVEGVIVFHPFAKKTRQAPPSEIQLRRRRLKEMLNEQD